MRLAYEAYDKAGRAVRDTLEASGLQEAAEQLRRQGLFVTRLSEAGSAGGSGNAAVAAPSSGRLRNKARHLAMFTRQLYVLASTGTPMVQALEALERQAKDARWRQVVADLRRRVEEGASLSEAMERRPDCFDAVYRSLVAAGESSGEFAAMLDRLAQLVRKQAQMRSTLIGAMVYPALLLSVSAIVLTVMFIFVLPRFAGLFQTLDVPLPAGTRVMIALGEALRSYGWVALLAAVGGGWALHSWLRTDQGRQWLDTLLVDAPGIGKVTRGLCTARTARLLGTLIQSRVPLLEALALTRQAAGNIHYERLIDRAEEAVSRGEPISAVFADERLISPSVYEAVRSGEATGQIGPLLLNVASFLEEENEVLLRSLTSLLEPLILIGLGVVVGLVAMSMFLPLFDLTASAGGG